MTEQCLEILSLEFLILKGGCRGSSESTHVKKSNCWKSHSTAHISLVSWVCVEPDQGCHFTGIYHKSS